MGDPDFQKKIGLKFDTRLGFWNDFADRANLLFESRSDATRFVKVFKDLHQAKISKLNLEQIEKLCEDILSRDVSQELQEQ